jgi:hypothetical protein
MTIDGWKKWIDFVKIKFYSNESIELDGMKFEVNSNQIA